MIELNNKMSTLSANINKLEEDLADDKLDGAICFAKELGGLK